MTKMHDRLISYGDINTDVVATEQKLASTKLKLLFM